MVLGVDHRRHDRGGRSRLRHDLFRRGEDAHPESVPGRTDFLTGGIIHVRRTWHPRCVWLRVLLLVCLPERVLPGERSSVIVPGHVSASDCACLSHPRKHPSRRSASCARATARPLSVRARLNPRPRSRRRPHQHRHRHRRTPPSSAPASLAPATSAPPTTPTAPPSTAASASASAST